MTNTTATKETTENTPTPVEQEIPAIQIATEADMPGAAPVELTDEQKTDPDFDIIAYAPEEDRNQFFSVMEMQLRKLYQSGDSVIALDVRPGSLETFMEWYSTFQFDENNPARDTQIRASIQIKPNPAVATVHVETYSQMENQWLYDHYNGLGLFEYLKTQLSPVRLAPQELRMLYAIESLTDLLTGVADNKPAIVTAHGGGKFDPAQLKMKIKR